MARPQHYLITGASGFLGHGLVAGLLERGHRVTALDIRPPKQEHDNLTFVEGSFTSLDVLMRIFGGVDCLIHLAASKFPKAAQQDPKADINENILGSFQLFEQAKEAGVRKILFSSSGGAIYGNEATVPISEDAQTNPIGAYGISKLAVEKYLRFFNAQFGIQTVSLRAANPYGPGQNIQNAQGALTTFCHKVIHGEPIEIWGDGKVERDYIYISDLTAALVMAAEQDVDVPVLNIGSGQGTSLNKLLEHIQTHFDAPLDVRYTPARSFDVQQNYLNIDRAKAALGWEPHVSLEDGIRLTLDHMRQTVDQ